MEDQGARSFPMSGILVLLATLGVILFTQTPLKGTRPVVPEVKEPRDTVNARLWQDPYLAVLEHIQSHPTKTQNGYNYVQRLAAEIKEQKGPVNILGVLVFGGPYVDSSEHRIRMRYAVLAGLRKLKYQPQDPEHIRFVTSYLGTEKQISLSNMVPYEWVTSYKDNLKPVLILWMNDDNYNKGVLNKILAELDALKAEVKRQGLGEDIIASTTILGPAGSTNFIEMLKDKNFVRAQEGGAGKTVRTKEKTAAHREKTVLNVLSPSASVDLLTTEEYKHLDLASDRSFTATYKMQTPGERTGKEHAVRFERTIAMDSVLFTHMIEELCLRGVNSSEPECGDGGVPSKVRSAVRQMVSAAGMKKKKADDREDHIVLISEWDTQYGRLLPRTFAKVLAPKAGLEEHDLSWVHQINYMRGIDGSVPGEDSAKRSGQEEDGRRDGDVISKLEQPMGKSQYDYLRRLAGKVRRMDQYLRRTGKGGVKAVGILGSDYYDKYLVLQALRQELPDAVYFTTDLDARFLQPDHLRWTRNVIVASSYGLELPYPDAVRPDKMRARDYSTNSITRGFPPFRDSYQASVFLATVRAFDPSYEPLIRQRSEHPLLFEIGRYSPQLLTRDEALPSERPALEVPLADTRGWYVKFGITALAGFFLVSITSNRIRTWFSVTVRAEKRWRLAAITGGVVALLAVLTYLVYIFDDQEPFSLINGVSVWPTEAIRLAALAMTFLFLDIGRRALKKSRKTLTREFELLDPLNTHPSSCVDSWTSVPPGRHGEEIDFDCCYRGDRDRDATVAGLWQRYMHRSKPKYRRRRIRIFMITYVVFCFLIMGIFGFPERPVRGNLSRAIDLLVLAASVISFLWLTFYVVDATRLFRSFITEASRIKRAWNSSLPAQAAEIEEWRLIKLIGKRTEVVGKLIFYPFIVWFLIFVSRIRFFDNWNMPLHLAGVILLGVFYAWSCAFILRGSAETARQRSLDRLSALQVDERAKRSPDETRLKQIDYIKEEIRKTRVGAFAPYMQHPVVQALVVPFGGIGGITLLDMFTKFNL